MFGANAVDGGHEIGVGNGVGGLLELPQVFGKAGDGCRRVVDDFRAVESEDSGPFREMAVVTDIHADAGVPGLKDRIAGVSRREVKLLPKARMTMGNVMLAVFAEITAIGVNHRGGVKVNAGHFDLIDGHDQHDLVFLREFLHQ